MDPHYPEEYTRWWVEFFYRKFQVNEHVLIPRLETESIVREAIKLCRSNPPDILIDIGTGSGIIPLSILSAVDIPQVFAVDLSPDALKVAEENNRNQKKGIAFLESDLLGVFLENTKQEKTSQKQGLKWIVPTKYNEWGTESWMQKSNFSGASVLIVTNLPYIKQDDWENMSADTVHEPKMALFGGERTGFELYDRLFAQIPDFIRKHQPSNLTILAEMGDDQMDTATEALMKHGWKFSFFTDLRWIERFMKIGII